MLVGIDQRVFYVQTWFSRMSFPLSSLPATLVTVSVSNPKKVFTCMSQYHVKRMLQSWVQPGSNLPTDAEDQKQFNGLFITHVISIQATSASPGNCDVIASAPGCIH